LLIAYGLRLAGFTFRACFGCGFGASNAVAQARFVGAHFAQLLLTLLNR
jgi:hypothetical protein